MAESRERLYREAAPKDFVPPPPPRFGSEGPSQKPPRMPMSPGAASDATYHPPDEELYSADEEDDAEQHMTESQFEREVADGLTDANKTYDQVRVNDTYRSRGYGVYSGKIRDVPFVPERDHPKMTALSSFVLEADDPSIVLGQARLYLHLFNTDLSKLVCQVWEEEHAETKLHDHQMDEFLTHGMLVLLTMSKEIVYSLIRGDLPRLRDDSNLATDDMEQARRFLRFCRQERDGMMSTGKYQPAIYGQFLCSGSGRGPRAVEMSYILQCLRRYIDDDEYAEFIDNVCRDEAEDKLTLRRHLKGRDRENELLQFMANVRAQVPTKSSQRMRPLAEFGYTNNFKKRLDDHRDHVKSNFIMNLVHAMCVQEEFLEHLRIRQEVIYQCWAPQHGWVAEILINRLGFGYTSTGFGMSYHPTGRSNASAGRIAPSHYNRWAGMAYKYSPFCAQLEERLQVQDELDQQHEKEVARMNKKTTELCNIAEKLLHETKLAKDYMARWQSSEEEALPNLKKATEDALQETNRQIYLKNCRTDLAKEMLKLVEDMSWIDEEEDYLQID